MNPGFKFLYCTCIRMGLNFFGKIGGGNNVFGTQIFAMF
jgi:hypothetical protein